MVGIAGSFDEPGGPTSYDLPEVEAARSTERNKEQDEIAFKQARAARFWASLLETEAGREEIWKLLVELGTFRLPFDVTDSAQPYEQVTWFNLGQKQAGECLLKNRLFINARDGVFKMLDEHDPAFKDTRRGPVPRSAFEGRIP